MTIYQEKINVSIAYLQGTSGKPGFQGSIGIPGHPVSNLLKSYHCDLLLAKAVHVTNEIYQSDIFFLGSYRK